MSDSLSTPAIEILRCPRCAGAVPLGDGASVRCAFCGSEVTIPEAHRALRDAERAEHATRKDAEAYYATLAKPPNAIVRAFGRTGASVAMVLLSPFMLIGAMVLSFRFMAMAERHWHVSFFDVHTKKWIDAHDAIITSAILIAVVLIGAFAQRTAVGRIKLRAALMAKLPEQPGGPALCRSCNAPLVVPPGAQAVRCTYCRTDNIVAVGPADIAAQTLAKTRVQDAVADAKQAGRADSKRIIWSIFWRLVLVSVLVMSVWIPVFQDAGTMHEPTEWDDLRIDISPIQFASVAACDTPSFHALAMRRGETFHATRIDGETAPIDVVVDAHLPGGEESWVEMPPRVHWAPGAPLDFVAPHTGWFNLCFIGPTTRIAGTLITQR